MQIVWAGSVVAYLFLLISSWTIPFMLGAGSVSGHTGALEKITVVEIASFY